MFMRGALFLASLGFVFVLSFLNGTGGCGGDVATETAGDTSGPTVASDAISPADGATGVGTSDSITVNFGEPMDTDSVGSAFSLAEQKEGSGLAAVTAASGTFSWNTDNSQLTFTPSSRLLNNTGYCVTIGTGAADSSGNPITAAVENCFTTKCASSDEFDRDDRACWTLYKFTFTGLVEEDPPGSFLTDLIVSDGTLTMDFNTTCSGLNGDPQCNNGVPVFAKQLAEGDFEGETAIISGLPSTSQRHAGLVVTTSDGNDFLFLLFDAKNNGGATVTKIQAGGVVNGSFDIVGTEQQLTASQLYLRITRSGSAWTLAYKTSAGGSYTTATTLNRTTAGDALGTSGTPLFFGIVGMANDGETSANTDGSYAPVFDFFRFNSGGAEGQE